MLLRNIRDKGPEIVDFGPLPGQTRPRGDWGRPGPRSICTVMFCEDPMLWDGPSSIWTDRLTELAEASGERGRRGRLMPMPKLYKLFCMSDDVYMVLTSKRI